MKNLIWILTCITLSMSLTSCSNDDDKKDPVLGIWSQDIGDSTYWFLLHDNDCAYTVTELGDNFYNKLLTSYRYDLQDNNRIKISDFVGVDSISPIYETWLEGTYTDTEILLSNDTLTFKLTRAK